MEPHGFLSLFLLLLLFTHLLLHLLSNKKKLPPGPTGLPIIGNLLAIGDRPHESLAKLAKKHGPLMTVKLGYNTTIVASSADMAKEILQKNDQAFSGRPLPHAVTAGTNHELYLAWMPGGPKWKNLRKLCTTQMFTTQRLDSLQGLRHQMMDNMVRRLVDASEAGESVYIGRLVFGTTMNLLSNTIFSIDLMDSKSDEVHELKELIWKIMELVGKPNLADYFPVLKPFDPQRIRRDVKVSYDRLRDLISDIIDRRLKRRESGSSSFGDFLNVLLDHSELHGPEQLNLQDIVALLTDLFVGGIDTTATTTEWAMSELLHNPGIMAKAKQELAETIGLGRSVEEKDILKLPYLQSVLKETMRLHPTAPLLLPHRTETNVEICGYTIPKHTQVFINAWAIERDPAYWDEPTSFMPERFLGSEVDFRGTNFTFIPFGSGRRICPGLNLAVRMLSLTLGSLVHHFDWALPDGITPENMDMTDKFGVTLQKAVPLVAIPKSAIA